MPQRTLRATRCRRCDAEVFWAHAGHQALLFDRAPVESTDANAYVVFPASRSSRDSGRSWSWLARRLGPYLDQLALTRGWSTRQALADVVERYTVHAPHNCRARVLTTHGAISAEAADA